VTVVNKQTTTNVNITQEANKNAHSIVTFSEMSKDWVADATASPFSSETETQDSLLDIQKFLARPVAIYTGAWGAGNDGWIVPVWRYFLQNPRVANKIAGYRNIRGDLNVKIVVNGSPHHYGRLLATYKPMTVFYDTDEISINSPPQYYVPASQRQHAWLNPATSQGVTFRIPYMWNRPMFSIVDEEYSDAGSLNVYTAVQLQHTNATMPNVTWTVYAWMDNVVLSGTTRSTHENLEHQIVARPILRGERFVAQANEAEQMSTGPISGPANAVAKAAGALESIPSLKPAARVTSMAASGIAATAKAFGMSKPASLAPTQTYKPFAMGNMTNSNMVDTATKLTYDAKQEVSISPAALGVGPEDEMSIKAIAQKESYLTTFTWDVDDAPRTMLWNTHVHPLMFDTFGANDAHKQYFFTPMAGVALPFKYWRGTIRYRLQIVANKFHRGKLSLVYDSVDNGADGAAEENVQQTRIVDIGEEQDIVFDIGWANNYAFLRIPSFEAHSREPLFSSTEILEHIFGETNGVFSIQVKEPLITQKTDNTDSIAVIVSCCALDDFEVAVPCERNLLGLTYTQPAFTELPVPITGQVTPDLEVSDSEDECTPMKRPSTDVPPAPIKHQSHRTSYFRGEKFISQAVEVVPGGAMGGGEQEFQPEAQSPDVVVGTKLDNSGDLYSLYYGDPITSLRQVLKRYSVSEAHCVDVDNETFTAYRVAPIFPRQRGKPQTTETADAFVTVGGIDYPWNDVYTNFLTYFTPFFLGWRGGIRHKLIFASKKGNHHTLMGVYARHDEETKVQAELIQTKWALSPSARKRGARYRVYPTDSGAVVTDVNVNPVLEVEFPYFDNKKFKPARRFIDEKYHFLLTYPAGSTNDPGCVIDMVAAGDDFTLMGFYGIPPFWYVPEPPPSETQ
jgi:hypothetical protein